MIYISSIGADVADPVYERAAEIFGLLSTTARLRIVGALCKQEMNVSELLQSIEISQPNMSQHLGLLYRAGLVTKRREGTQVYYSLDEMSSVLKCGDVRALLEDTWAGNVCVQ